MKRILALVVLSIVWGTHSEAQAGKKFWRKLYKVSQYVSIGVNVADSHSSWGRIERNPLLANSQGRFADKAVAIKFGVLGGWLLVQQFTNKGGQHDKIYVIVNLGSSAAIGGVAVSNYKRSK